MSPSEPDKRHMTARELAIALLRLGPHALDLPVKTYWESLTIAIGPDDVTVERDGQGKQYVRLYADQF